MGGQCPWPSGIGKCLQFTLTSLGLFPKCTGTQKKPGFGVAYREAGAVDECRELGPNGPCRSPGLKEPCQVLFREWEGDPRLLASLRLVEKDSEGKGCRAKPRCLQRQVLSCRTLGLCWPWRLAGLGPSRAGLECSGRHKGFGENSSGVSLFLGTGPLL